MKITIDDACSDVVVTVDGLIQLEIKTNRELAQDEEIDLFRSIRDRLDQTINQAVMQVRGSVEVTTIRDAFALKGWESSPPVSNPVTSSEFKSGELVLVQYVGLGSWKIETFISDILDRSMVCKRIHEYDGKMIISEPGSAASKVVLDAYQVLMRYRGTSVPDIHQRIAQSLMGSASLNPYRPAVNDVVAVRDIHNGLWLLRYYRDTLENTSFPYLVCKSQNPDHTSDMYKYMRSVTGLTKGEVSVNVCAVEELKAIYDTLPSGDIQ